LPKELTHGNGNSAFADNILKTIYGMDVQKNESYVEHAETTLAGLAAAGHPGSFLVDLFPIMKIIPEWFPGAGWKRKASMWRYVNSIVANCLWDSVKERVVRVCLLVLYHSMDDIYRKRERLNLVLLRQ
jgi:hypothetical protein